jgi:hypothetical protein
MSETTSDVETLSRMFVDGAYGAAAGLVGSLLLTGTLLLLSLVGAFDVAVFGETAAQFALGPAAPAPSTEVVVAGYLIFLTIGSVAWPLVLASIGTYLPGSTFAARGPILGAIVWLGFAIGYSPDPSTVSTGQLGLFLVGSFVGHLGYGYVTGALFERLFSERDPYVTALAGGGSVTGSTTTPRGSPSTDDDATATPSAADRARSATAGADARTRRATDTPGGGVADTAASRANGHVPDATADVTPAPSGDSLATAESPDADGLVASDEAMPPLLQFNRAINEIEAALDGSASEYDSFERLKTAYAAMVAAKPEGRPGKVSDFKPYLNAAQDELPEDRTIDRWLESMQNRVDHYMKTRQRLSEVLHLTAGQLFVPGADDPSPVRELQGERATIKTTVVNQGDRAAAVLRVSFYYDDDGERVLVRSEDLPLGYVEAGGRKRMETDVYVPSIAEAFDVDVLDPVDGQTFLQNADALRNAR